MSDTFCQICRHPSHVIPGHMPDCPVYTGEPQRVYEYYGGPLPYAGFIRQEDIQGMPQVEGQMGSFGGAGTFTQLRLLDELRMQVEVNKRLAKALMECRMELEALKGSRGV